MYVVEKRNNKNKSELAWLGDQDFTSLSACCSSLCTWLAYFSTLVFHQQSLDSVATCAEGV